MRTAVAFTIIAAVLLAIVAAPSKAATFTQKRYASTDATCAGAVTSTQTLAFVSDVKGCWRYTAPDSKVYYLSTTFTRNATTCSHGTFNLHAESDTTCSGTVTDTMGAQSDLKGACDIDKVQGTIVSYSVDTCASAGKIAASLVAVGAIILATLF